MNVSKFVLLLACVAAAPSETAAEDASCQDGNVRATVIALKLNELKKAQVERVEQALGAVQGVMRASFNFDSKIMMVFVDVDGFASADKLLKYLELAGYAGTEASEQELERALGAMRAGDGMIVFRREDASADARSVTFPDTPAGGKLGEVTLLTESVKPLRDHFNANKHKYRFVALLSPT